MSDKLNAQEIAMLREELEILMNERTGLLKVAGAAAVLVANTDGRNLWVLGNERFLQQIEDLSQRQALPKPRGGDKRSKKSKGRKTYRV
jgi:hypothetical protein